MLSDFVRFIREYYQRPQEAIPLHEAAISARDYQWLQACLDSGMVSTVGSMVPEFEEKVAERVGVKYAVATHSGTAALHLALLASGVEAGDLVITQPLSFVASCNAIRYCGADPVFADIDRQTLGLSADELAAFLEKETVRKDGWCYHKASGKKIAACLPVCTFGHAPALDTIQNLCQKYAIQLVVDAAEALGSQYQNQAIASWGDVAILSFNGNKIVTSGGGGMLLTEDAHIAEQARHLSVQARTQQNFQISYDALGYNYRMPNLNAALGLAQLEKLEEKVLAHRKLAEHYQTFFQKYVLPLVRQSRDSYANYWLNALAFPDQTSRDAFVAQTNQAAILTRSAWTLMTHLRMYQNCIRTPLPNAEWAEKHLALLPSFPNLDNHKHG